MCIFTYRKHRIIYKNYNLYFTTLRYTVSLLFLVIKARRFDVNHLSSLVTMTLDSKIDSNLENINNFIDLIDNKLYDIYFLSHSQHEVDKDYLLEIL